MITKFKKIFPNLEDFKKDFKLFIFSSYFEEPEYNYIYETEIKQEDINNIKKALKTEFPVDKIPNLDDLCVTC